MDYSIIIGVACLGAVLQEVPLWNRFLDALMIDVKPFNCALCFTWWVTLGPFIITEGVTGIFSSITAAVLADLINRQMNRS
jgi:hypothetical protein